MSILSRLFGGAPKTEIKPEMYKDFSIMPSPTKEGSQYRISALIEKEIDGETKSHTLIRADMMDDLESANTASIGKAKTMIDQLGDSLFG